MAGLLAGSLRGEKRNPDLWELLWQVNAHRCCGCSDLFELRQQFDAFLFKRLDLPPLCLYQRQR